MAIRVPISPELRRLLEERARREGKTVEQVFEEALKRALDEEVRWS